MFLPRGAGPSATASREKSSRSRASKPSSSSSKQNRAAICRAVLFSLNRLLDLEHAFRQAEIHFQRLHFADRRHFAFGVFYRHFRRQPYSPRLRRTFIKERGELPAVLVVNLAFGRVALLRIEPNAVPARVIELRAFISKVENVLPGRAIGANELRVKQFLHDGWADDAEIHRRLNLP